MSLPRFAAEPRQAKERRWPQRPAVSDFGFSQTTGAQELHTPPLALDRTLSRPDHGARAQFLASGMVLIKELQAGQGFREQLSARQAPVAGEQEGKTAYSIAGAATVQI